MYCNVCIILIPVYHLNESSEYIVSMYRLIILFQFIASMYHLTALPQCIVIAYCYNTVHIMIILYCDTHTGHIAGCVFVLLVNIVYELLNLAHSAVGRVKSSQRNGYEDLDSLLLVEEDNTKK